MPSGHPPHKRDHAVTDAEDRCEMTKLAIRDYPYFRFSDFEVKRQGNTYTAQTLTLLNEQYPDSRFFFIIGADSLFEIENWYMPERIMAQAVLLVAGRAYSRASRSLDDQILYLRERYHSEIYRLHLEEMDVASVRLRRMAAEGQNLRPYVPTAVWEYIKTHHLYEERQD